MGKSKRQKDGARERERVGRGNTDDEDTKSKAKRRKMQYPRVMKKVLLGSKKLESERKLGEKRTGTKHSSQTKTQVFVLSDNP